VAFVTRVARAALVLAAIISCCLAGLAMAKTRSASSRFAIGSPSVQKAQTLAVAHWGWAPCGGQVSIVWRRQAGDINAMSVWTTAGTDPYADPADNQDCVIELNPVASWSWPKLCTVIVHEYGHLTGHDHDPRTGRLMSPLYTTPLPECATAEPRRASSRVTARGTRSTT
jgi:hypothetical protein